MYFSSSLQSARLLSRINKNSLGQLQIFSEKQHRHLHSSKALRFPYSNLNDWRTTKGNIAPDLHWSGRDDAFEQRASLKQYVESNYPGARVIADATRTYNCHGYAHTGGHAWFDVIDRFIQDDYFPYTPGTLMVGDICVYVKNGSITHSAVIISLNGNSVRELRSKWGALPQVIHGPNNVPADYGSIVYYLRKRNMASVLSEDETKEINYKQSKKLLEIFTSNKQISPLMLASSFESLEQILTEGFGNKLVEFQLQGQVAEELLCAALDKVDLNNDEHLIPLLFIAKKCNSSKALPIIAEKIKMLSKDDYTFAQLYMLDVFQHISTRLENNISGYENFHERCMKNADAIISRLKQKNSPEPKL